MLAWILERCKKEQKIGQFCHFFDTVQIFNKKGLNLIKNQNALKSKELLLNVTAAATHDYQQT